MLTGTQSGIVVAYDDPNGELDFTVTGGGGSGENNQGLSLGNGEPVYAGKQDTTLTFKSLLAGANVTLTPTDTTITIAATGDGTGTDDQNITGSSFNTGNGELTIGIENGSSQAVDLDGRYLQTEVDGAITNEIQEIDTLQLTGTTLEMSLSQDGVGLQSVDLSSLQDGTGVDFTDSLTTFVTPTQLGDSIAAIDVGIESLVWSNGLSSTILTDGETFSVQGGANGVDVNGGGTNDLTVNLDFTELATTTSLIAGTDFVIQEGTLERKIDESDVQEWIEDWLNNSFLIAGTDLTATYDDPGNTWTLDYTGSAGTDDQTIDTLQLTGTTLEVSLEGDGEPAQTVDLSSLQDGTGTDDQNITGSTFNTGTGQLTIGIENGTNQSLSLDGRYLTSEVDGSTTNEIQEVDTLQLSGTTLEISLSQDGVGLSSVDLSSLQDGTGLTSFTWGNGLGSTTITDGETITVQGGANGIDVAGGGNNDLTVNLDFTELAFQSTVDTDFSFAGIKTGTGIESRINDEIVQEWIADWLAGTFLIAGDSLTATYDDPAGTWTIDYTGTGGGGGTDDQVVDTFQITANQLEISLENDGVGILSK